MKASRRRPPVAVAGALTATLVLAGCGAGSAGEADSSARGQDPPFPTHTMPDGTVMRGARHPGGLPSREEDSPAQDSQSGGGDSANPAGPSPAARMVCGNETAQDVKRILALDEVPHPSWSWDEPFFTCTFELPAGPLVLTVHDATDPAKGRAYFEQLQASVEGAEPLDGLASYGLPAFETDDGKVAFIRDGKTLLVDATALTGELSQKGGRVPPDVAYAVASSVLFCWVHADHDNGGDRGG